jgi:hypothetical protein
MSRETRLMWGITLITVPTIVFGGLAILGVVSGGRFGLPAPPDLTAAQVVFYRAGHAHAGVLLILSLLLQLGVDQATLPRGLVWPIRIGAPAAAILVSGGFFGVAHLPALAILLYAGAVTLIAVTLAVGIGMVRAPQPR